MTGIVILAFLLCAINVIGWLIFLSKFKSLFNTDDIMNKTRTEIRGMIDDVNRVTAKNLDLIDSKIKQIKVTAADADRHISVAKFELDKQAKLSQYQAVIDNKISTPQNNGITADSMPRKSYSERAVNAYERLSDGLSSVSSYSITNEGKRALNAENDDLFETRENIQYVSSSAGTKFTVDHDGASVASIPKISPNITFVDEPVRPKKTINEQVKELSDKGYSVDLIAKELGITTIEVECAIALGL